MIVGSASHGTLGQVLVGNVGLSLLHGSPCAVAIAPRGFAESAAATLSGVTVGFDGSDEARTALADAVDLARAAGAPLKVATVVEPPPLVYGKGGGATQGWQELKGAAEEVMRGRLDEALASVPGDVSAEGELVTGDPAEELAKIALGDGGVLVLGSRAYGPLRRVLLGSASTALVRSAPCAVIVHPRSAEGAA